MNTELAERARRWIAADVDESARAELAGVLDRAAAGDDAAATELADRMAGSLTFGTAGLRGPVRAGPNGMNSAVVARTTAGVATWLAQHGHAGGVVVLGRDARHGSAAFARVAAEVFDAAGFDVRVLPRPLPTPVLAFAVNHLGAVAGVQITASHNPPADNGYKLYDHTGQQIVPPADGEIESAIGAAPAANAVPRSTGAVLANGAVGDEVLGGYLARVATLPAGEERSLRVAATALHGVGAEVLEQAMTRAGFAAPHLVGTQSEPDPEFPTVHFPNPEEPGVTDALRTLAADVDADIAIALDPDADRCAVGVPTADGWQMLHGDETGVLLGKHVLARTDSTDPLVATTIVSSSMLGSVARAHGARYAETLTGFKWLTRAGEGLVYAYEEALGLCVDPDFVRDKDGISAAVLACDLAATLSAAGRTLGGALDELSVAHGVHRTGQVIVRVERVAEIAALMTRLRTNPPETLLSNPVTVEDLQPTTDALRLRGGGCGGHGGLRVVVRPSGTEPKLKAYLEVVSAVHDADGLPMVRGQASERLAALHTEVESLLAS